jgi:V/A-type H+-transporting ATPase subunit E
MKMKTFDKGQDKIQKISDELRKETLEPAKKQAATIVEEARKKAEDIIADGYKQVEKFLGDARTTVEQERNVFQSSLVQASRQSIETLRQNIENRLFNQQLDKVLEKHVVDPKVISNLINAIVEAVQKQGISANFSAIIPGVVSEEDINILLLDGVLKSLKEKSVVLGDISGGVQVKLHDKRLTVDISEKAIKELLAQHIRKGFRTLLFES